LSNILPISQNIPLGKQLKICKKLPGTLPETLPEQTTGTKIMTKNKRSVTIIDVAEAAGVSISTVSWVLNKKDDVSEATFQRVEEVIAEFGTSSSLAARSMRSRQTNVIGLIMPDVDDPFSVEVSEELIKLLLNINKDGSDFTPKTADEI